MGAKTDNTADKKRIEELRRLLAYHSKLYYEKDEPEISDYEYDMMFKELKELESAHPELDSGESPTHRVGGRADERFGKVICRCETITEGEIVEALTRNPRAMDIDGVKRRTRAGMGRCQAGFCTPQTVEIIARELGIAMEAVSKSGPGSELLLGRTK